VETSGVSQGPEGKKAMMKALREKLSGIKQEGRFSASMIAMWDYVLAYHQSEESGTLDPCFTAGPCCDAFPYVPDGLESQGVVLQADSVVADLGCFGGYGLYDFARRRMKANLPVPAMMGIDKDPGSIDLSRQMAGIWAQEYRISFYEADAVSLPVQSASVDMIISRLLLPYVRVRETLKEISRVLKPGGVALFQLHSFEYYFMQMRANIRNPSTMFYYTRPVLSGIAAACTGTQPENKWFSETAMTAGMMERWAANEGLSRIWAGGFSLKPMVIYRKIR